jgi:hypothetical protein
MNNGNDREMIKTAYVVGTFDTKGDELAIWRHGSTPWAFPFFASTCQPAGIRRQGLM